MNRLALPSQIITGAQLKAKKDALRGLKVSQLASYDDFLTDLLIDQVYFWSTIRKNRNRYSNSRYLKEKDISKILQQHVIIEKDAQKGVDELLKLTGVRKYVDRLSEGEQDHFKQHMRKYVNIYLPDCPFEISTTNRYTIDTQEAATTARRVIKPGESVKYLVGVHCAITKEEEEDLDLSRRDFSIVISKLKRLPSLFLGPARFANHDCAANARLTSKGPNGMAVTASKRIEVGDEIVVSYGDDYFGDDNCDCLCHTCEVGRDQETGIQGVNGWNPNKLEVDEDEDRDNEGERDAKVARLKPEAPASSSVKHLADPAIATGLEPSESKRLKRKREDESGVTTPSRGSRLEVCRKSFLNHSLSTLRQGMSSNDDSDRLRDQTTDSAIAGFLSERSRSPASVFERAQQASDTSTSATSTSDHVVPVLDLATDEVPVRGSSIWSMPYAAGHSMVRDSFGSPAGSRRSSDISQGQSDSELSDLDDVTAVDGSSQWVRAQRAKTPRPVRRTRASGIEALKNSGSGTPIYFEPNEISDPNVRRPGDYCLARRLLSTPYSRWNKCRVCKEYFVQSDAYQTRWSCPRCERHSKLYGYVWPKTDKLSSSDAEERVLDHREINRFVHGEEERWIRKGKKTITELARREQERRLRGESTDDEVEVSFGANPRQFVEDWLTDDDVIMTGIVKKEKKQGKEKRRKQQQKSEPARAAAERERKLQKRDFNSDGSLRQKRSYNWSGRYLGRWNKRHPPSDNIKFGGVHPATATAKRAASASADSSPHAARTGRSNAGTNPAKRNSAKRGTRGGLEAPREDENDGSPLQEEVTEVAKRKKLKLTENRAKKRAEKEEQETRKREKKEKEREKKAREMEKEKQKKKKKQKWKGWTVVDEDGNEISPPTSPGVKVARFHPKVKEQTIIDVDQWDADRRRSRRISGPAAISKAPIATAPPVRTSRKIAPRRSKGYVYLDEDGNPMADPASVRSRIRNLKQESPPPHGLSAFGEEDSEEEEDTAVAQRTRRSLRLDNATPSSIPGNSSMCMRSNSNRAATHRARIIEDERSSTHSDFSLSEDEEERPTKRRKSARSGKSDGRNTRPVAVTAPRQTAKVGVRIKVEDEDYEEPNFMARSLGVAIDDSDDDEEDITLTPSTRSGMLRRVRRTL